MLACYLRPSKIDGARHAAAVVKLFFTRLRQVWPATRFIVRADSGFCRLRLLHWCERAGIGYIIGLARNARLHSAVELAEVSLADGYWASGAKQRLIGEFSYAAKMEPRAARHHAAGVRQPRYQPALHCHQPAKRFHTAV
jgi:hypothetical protein